MADGGTFGGNGEGVEGIFVGGVRVDMVFFFERAFGGSTSPVDPHCHGFLNADLAD